MYNYLRKNIVNILGWNTKRKIVVFESDDWGSVRIKNNSVREILKNYEINVNEKHFDRFDSLESNQDLEYLFDLLLSFKNRYNQSPVFTSMCIMGNPDFNKIQLSDYSQYYFQPLSETLIDYSNSSRLIDLWKQGLNNNIFIPELHGREHVNVRRYMNILTKHEGREGMRIALSYHSFGPSLYKSYVYPNYLGALHPEKVDEIPELHQQLLEAGELYNKYLNKAPKVFIAPNSEEPKELEKTLDLIGIKYITRSKWRTYPLGDGKFKSEWNFIGKQNEFGQIYLNRNAFFEPAAVGKNVKSKDWIDSCLHDIGIAFRWHKPAVISSHRVNYVGSIDPLNREIGLRSLKQLLSKALKKWPDIEFMSSSELGDLISRTR